MGKSSEVRWQGCARKPVLEGTKPFEAKLLRVTQLARKLSDQRTIVSFQLARHFESTHYSKMSAVAPSDPSQNSSTGGSSHNSSRLDGADPAKLLTHSNST